MIEDISLEKNLDIVKNEIPGGAQIKEGSSPEIMAKLFGSAAAYIGNFSGKINQYIQIEGNHGVSIKNENSSSQWYKCTYIFINLLSVPAATDVDFDPEKLSNNLYRPADFCNSN